MADAGENGEGEEGESGSKFVTIIVYGVGVMLILAGLGGLISGGLESIGGLIWILTGLFAMPVTRSPVLGALAGAGGPEIGELGRAAVVVIVVGGLFAGGIVGGAGSDGPPSDPAPDSGSPQETPAPTEALEPTDAADGGGSSGSDGADSDTPTPEPTSTPTPEPTPTPTPEPTPTSTPEPTPAPDGESYDYSGSGQTATDRFAAEGGLVTIDLSHQGESNFIVYLVNADTGEEELLVNTIGDFDGKVATNVPAGEYLLDIDADGSWEADVEQPRFSQVEVDSLPADVSEEDYAVLGPIQFEGVTRFIIDAETDGNVIAWLKDHRGNDVQLLVNEIGPHEGSTTIRQEGVGIIYVETEDSWTVTIEQA